jgi:uncharacterized OsmC-like protein
MPSIESIAQPLVYKVDKSSINLTELPQKEGITAVRASVRALEGMQKEAIVQYSPTGTVWRMVSDEGPYLNGTDLAPFPLASYTTGMALSFMEEIYKQAESRQVNIHTLRLILDNFYTMQGSAIRGDMMGGAKPVEIIVEIDADASEELIQDIVRAAEKSSPAQAYNRDVIDNTFALSLNSQQIPVKRVTASANKLIPDPSLLFEQLQALDTDSYEAEIISKLESAETVFNVEGGAGSSLQSEQKRTLHVRGIASRRDDGLNEVIVQLFKPIGSIFRFLSDNSEQERAPRSLAYLTVGIGFCFMTQLGRYAHIVKKPLDSYEIVQDNHYHYGSELARNEPVDTHVYIRFDESDEEAKQILHMSEQTCFLHAAMRNAVPSNIVVRIGEKELAL